MAYNGVVEGHECHPQNAIAGMPLRTYRRNSAPPLSKESYPDRWSALRGAMHSTPDVLK
jgi:hypothetical protein